MKLILLCVWAEPADLGRTKTALKFKHTIQCILPQTLQCMGQDISLKSETKNPLFKPFKHFTAHTINCSVFNSQLMIIKLHGFSPSDGFAWLLFDQVGYYASIKLCQALSRQGAIFQIPVVRCHYLLCLGAQWLRFQIGKQFHKKKTCIQIELRTHVKRFVFGFAVAG